MSALRKTTSNLDDLTPDLHSGAGTEMFISGLSASGSGDLHTGAGSDLYISGLSASHFDDIHAGTGTQMFISGLSPLT